MKKNIVFWGLSWTIAAYAIVKLLLSDFAVSVIPGWHTVIYPQSKWFLFAWTAWILSGVIVLSTYILFNAILGVRATSFGKTSSKKQR